MGQCCYIHHHRGPHKHGWTSTDFWPCPLFLPFSVPGQIEAKNSMSEASNTVLQARKQVL